MSSKTGYSSFFFTKSNNNNLAKFIKCSLCDEKPATIRCLTCTTRELKPKKYCYHCEKTQHEAENMHHHKKELIPYSGN